MGLSIAQKKEIDRLRQRDGTITTTAIIEAAKNKKSSLHSEFQWDIKKAAYDSWTHTARGLLREYKLVITTTHTTLRFEPPAYIHDPNLPGNETGYKSTAVIKDSRSEARTALQRKAQQCLGHLSTFHDLALFWDFDATAINEAIDNINDFVNEISKRAHRDDESDDEVVVGLE